jgi:integrase
MEKATMKLSAKNVPHLTLSEGENDKIYRDDELHGFGYRLRRTGNGINRTWTIQYRHGKTQRRISLDVSKFDISAARKVARDCLAKVQLGQDPAGERNKKREEANAVKLTLADVAERFMRAKKDVISQSTFAGYKRHFERGFADLMPRPITEISRAEIAAILQDVIQTTGRTAAARARSILSTLYVWALKEGLIENSQNPVALVNDPLAGIDNSRDRVLSDAELVKVWKACGEDDFGRIIKLLVLTGCRRDEIGSLRWSEIDLDHGTLSIPAERSKNGKAHTLALPPIALDILRSIQRRDGREYLFGQSGKGFQRWNARTTQMRERLGDMQHFTLHDLRRTFRTGLGRLGIPSHVAELAINHVRQGIQAVYDRHTYQGEIASALALWADHVQAVLDGRDHKVVKLRRV